MVHDACMHVWYLYVGVVVCLCGPEWNLLMDDSFPYMAITGLKLDHTIEYNWVSVRRCSSESCAIGDLKHEGLQQLLPYWASLQQLCEHQCCHAYAFDDRSTGRWETPTCPTWKCAGITEPCLVWAMWSEEKTKEPLILCISSLEDADMCFI